MQVMVGETAVKKRTRYPDIAGFRQRLNAAIEGRPRKKVYMDAGISEATLARLLGQTAEPVDDPPLSTVASVAKAAGVTVSYLLGEDLERPTPEEREQLAKLLAVASQVDELREWATVRLRPTPEVGAGLSAERVKDDPVTEVTNLKDANVNTSASGERGTRPVPAGPDVRPTTDLYGGTDAEQEQGQRRHGDKDQPEDNHGTDPASRGE